jgi:glycosyltransferase involved in cell wall biosynthesis
MSDSLSIAHVGTYPPTRCGIATFTRSLVTSIAANAPRTRQGVVSCVEEPGVVEHPPEVVGELVASSPESRAWAAEAVNEFDVVVLQHEFGIFGGADGDDVLDLVSRIESPLVVVPHTVPSDPTPEQQEIVERICEHADAVVALSGVARTRLVERFGVPRERVRRIPHGAMLDRAPRADRDGRRILTWGLIGPGKGIEWGIEAMAYLRELEPPPHYVVLGQTHPKVWRRRGEEYRESLLERARVLGVRDLVTIEDRYRDSQALLEQVRLANVVLLPYDSRDQAVSGVLTDALGAGRPVVATGFPHAVELLGHGSGIVVPHQDPEAIADALRRFFTEPGLAERLESVAREQARSLAWPAAGRAYHELALEVVEAPAGVSR